MKNNSLLVMFSSGNIGSGPFFSLNALYAYKTGEHLVQLFLGIYKVRSLVLLLLLLLLFVSITFTSNGKREFLPGLFSPLLVVYCSLFLHINQ